MHGYRLGFGLFAALALGDPASAQDVLKIAVPQRGAWDTAIPELGQRAGIFKKHGLTLEILYTQGGPESIQAVVSRSMDIGTGVGVSAAVGAFAKGAPIRVIGSEMIGSPDLFWYVLPASPIRKIEDLNGKTIGFSQAGSSSNAALLELLKQYKLDAKPVALGGMQATFTQTMTGQVDVGWAAAPFALDAVADGKIRIVARGTDVAALKERTARVNVTNLTVLEQRRDALGRFMRGYLETIDWMYSDPDALKLYGEYSQLPATVVQRVREFIPKETIAPERVVGLDQIVADAVKLKFIADPLTPAQIKELVQIPTPQ
ncbi:MAG: ABC transporter substrate-binding protein [Xanthobacteraceae bacterium]|jgi:ABC-type nitrate/sulfonate/bicarbonate transport system substrate-binding protein